MVIQWVFIVVAIIGAADALYRGWRKWRLVPKLKGENAIRSTLGYSGELIISAFKDLFWVALVVFGERLSDTPGGLLLALFGIGCYAWATVNRWRWRLIISTEEEKKEGE